MLLRIVADHFVAGLIIDDDGTVVHCAPILKYMRRWDAARVVSYCLKKDWIVDEVKT